MNSFFGTDAQKKQFSGGSGGGPVVRKVFKKPVPKPGQSSNSNTTPRLGQSSTSSRPTGIISSSYSGNGSRNGMPTTSKGKEKQSGSTPTSKSTISASKKSSARPSSSTPSGASAKKAQALKRKVEQDRIESESSGSEDAVDLLTSNKRSRTNGNGNGSSTPILGMGEERIGKDRQLFRVTTDNGWEGFVPGDEIVRGTRKAWDGKTEEEGKVRSMLDKYVAYFPQEGFEKQEPLPFVELQYPAKGCKEKFYLLNPTASREFAPLRELRTAIQQILEFYIPPTHRHIFGTLSDSLDLDSPAASRVQSPSPAVAAFPTPPSSGASPPSAAVPTETIGDAIRKALAPNRRDGPGFLKAMERFNAAMQDIQNDGSMAQWLEVRGKEVKAREWAKLVDVVHDQAYGRVVGPYSNELEHHPKHPEEVASAITAKEDAYGELRHDFMTKVIEQTGLGPKSVFGVGNCVTQVALQAGSRSYGFELLPVPAHCARLQMEETKRRWAMWCLNGNTDIEAHEGDFRTIPDVAKRLRDADVVLVNNEVFPSSLNIDLTNMFLDLKDGAKIVSLKPFVPEGFRMNESNCDSFAAIVKLATHHYAQGWVSWKGDSGRYYIQTIDRSARIKYEERMSGRSRR